MISVSLNRLFTMITALSCYSNKISPSCYGNHSVVSPSCYGNVAFLVSLVTELLLVAMLTILDHFGIIPVWNGVECVSFQKVLYSEIAA